MTYFHQRRANCRIDHFMAGNSGLSYRCSRAALLKFKKTRYFSSSNYVGENFFVNLYFSLTCSDTGRRELDVCMDLKLIKYSWNFW